ncbi:MAG: glutamate--tRNA ligase family protein [Lentisphaeria bacterium]
MPQTVPAPSRDAAAPVATPVSAPIRTRLAPTPSGALHAGNAYSFLLAWLWARSQGGQVVLRIEDVDVVRARPDWVEALFRDLEWLGLDWDAGPAGPGDTASPYRQSSPERQARYAAVWQAWKDAGRLYPCRCTRTDLRTDAPQVARLGDTLIPGVPYSGRCRPRTARDAGPADAWRLRLPDAASTLADRWLGTHRLDRLDRLGDPVLRRADGCTAYHLAVCIDDFDQGITHVVRGRDLLPYAHLHRQLHALLGNPAPPDFCHHGLLGDSQGQRLAKRLGSDSLTGMRSHGFDSRRLVGALAPLIFPGAVAGPAPCSPRELLALGPPRPAAADRPWSRPE